ncbi:MAG TPA: NAD(P)-dependent oxidoreductase [Roseovarius sp.]|nr:NAD(P)-dependent oxidoreductase [Roseovarius sp.]
MRTQAGITGGRIAVTGASGFIGRYLCEDLAAAGYEPRALGRESESAAGVTHGTDYSRDSLLQALEGARAVVHLAGRRMTRADDPQGSGPFLGPNVAMIADLVEAARIAGLERIVLASSIAIYGPASGLPYRESAPPDPGDAYARSKLMAEASLGMRTRVKGPVAVALRLAAVYGHGEKGTPALMRFVNQAQAGETITLTGNPDYRIDQIYVRDATAAIIAALRSDGAEGVYNIGGGVAWPVRQIAETANAVFGNAGNLIDKTDSDAPMPHRVMSLDRAARDLGWSPRYDLWRGMEEMQARALAETGKGEQC